MTPQERVILAARAEVGYLEKASNRDLDDKTANAGTKNFTKYAYELDKLGTFNGPKNGYAWCAVFVTWLFTKTFGLETALTMLAQFKGGYGASCTWAAGRYKAVGRFVKTPQAGDQIFFTADGKSSNHTGIVVEVKDGRVYTVEGNTSGTSGVVANGGGVCAKNYALTSKSIYGYGRPDWSLVVNREEEVDMTKEEVKALVADEVAAATAKTAEVLLEGVHREVERVMTESAPKVYNTVEECPEWVMEAVRWAVDSGYIQGDEHGRLGLDNTRLWALQVMYNTFRKGK